MDRQKRKTDQRSDASARPAKRMRDAAQPLAKRIRRRPEEAENEILDAARAFLAENDFRDLTVREVMKGTGMRRSAFYNYFEDRYELVLGLVEQIEGEFAESSRSWFEASEDHELRLATALERGALVWTRHGRVLRALNEASYHDHAIEQYYRQGLVQKFIDAVAVKVRAENQAGRASVPEPRSIAEGLVLLNIQLYLEHAARAPDPERARDVAKVVQYIWMQVIYPGTRGRLHHGQALSDAASITVLPTDSSTGSLD